MFFLVVTTLLAFFGSVIAEDTSAASPCAATCVNNVFSNGGGIGCAPGDILCVCKNPGSLNDGIRDCVVQACVGPLGESPDQVGFAQQHGSLVCAALVSLSKCSDSRGYPKHDILDITFNHKLSVSYPNPWFTSRISR
ncbi:putative cfem domain protein [Eutypa lata UCREL1]|uniref:Putative cfem domain protein n=1 Tax=Eutypa lata (strain UCR-EL1) TaxID=1287681 RepID=M7SBH9_EUTLA|nr:putative cfem domain protein [Eutypa lata UCREL1]